jgi:hypothetical protein
MQQAARPPASQQSVWEALRAVAEQSAREHAAPRLADAQASGTDESGAAVKRTLDGLEDVYKVIGTSIQKQPMNALILAAILGFAYSAMRKS